MSSWSLKFEYLDELDRQAAMPAHEVTELTEAAHRLPSALGLRASETDRTRALKAVLARHQGNTAPHSATTATSHPCTPSPSSFSKEEGFAGRAGWVRPASSEAHAAELAELDHQIGGRWKKGWFVFNPIMGCLLPGIGFVLALFLFPHNVASAMKVGLPFVLLVLGLAMNFYGDIMNRRLRDMQSRRHRLTRYNPGLNKFQRWSQIQRWTANAATEDAFNACLTSPIGLLNLDVEHLEAWADELEEATKAAREAKLHAQWERLNTGSLTAF